MPNMYLPIKTDLFRQMGLKRRSKELGSILEYIEHTQVGLYSIHTSERVTQHQTKPDNSKGHSLS